MSLSEGSSSAGASSQNVARKSSNYLSQSQIHRIIKWKRDVEIECQLKNNDNLVLPKIPASRKIKKILAVTRQFGQGELMFVVLWKDTSEADLVLASEANLKWPQAVIRFYEKRIKFHRVRENQPLGDKSTGGKVEQNKQIVAPCKYFRARFLQL